MRWPYLAALLIVSVCSNGVSAPVNSQDIDAEADWILHVDMEKLRTSDVGSFLLKRMETTRAADQLRALQAVLNFDPRKDLDSVTAYGGGSAKRRHDGILLVRGRFDWERLLTLLRASDGYESRQSGERTLHGWIDAKAKARALAGGEVPKKTYGCIYNEQLLVLAGSQENVERAIGVLERRLPSLRGSSTGEKLTNLSADVLLVYVAKPQKTSLSPDTPLTVLNAANEITFCLSENGGFLKGNLVLATAAAEEANAVKMIVEGMLALAILKADKDPLAAGFAKHFSVSLDGARLRGELSYPIEQLKADLETAVGAQRPE
ncbi:MAG: hypothetical protein ACUVWX_02115 [Kiritimatiellia bacterium]